VFKRRRGQDAADEAAEAEELDEVDDADAHVVEAADEVVPSPPERPQGPWDVEDAPDDDRPRLDLGGLRVLGVEGAEIRLDVDEASGQVVAVTVVKNDGAIQMQGFAAPRTQGLWADVREEIATGLSDGGGSSEEVEGPFGVELHAMVPIETPDGYTVPQPVRFIGVDGPRWFLRAVVSGKALTDESLRAQLLEVFRETVVVRGGEAMGPRSPLPLRMPDSGGDTPAADPEGRPPLEPFQRGPEITEIR
jgi:hypothetical protein